MMPLQLVASLFNMLWNMCGHGQEHANTTQVRFEPRSCNTALPIVDISFFYILDMIRTQSLKENYYHLLSPVKCMLNPHTSLEMSVYSMTSWQIVVVTIGTID